MDDADPEVDELKRIFDEIDTDKNGYITAPALAAHFSMNEDDAKAIANDRELVDEDDKIRLPGFIRWMKHPVEVPSAEDADGTFGEGEQFQS